MKIYIFTDCLAEWDTDYKYFFIEENIKNAITDVRPMLPGAFDMEKWTYIKDPKQMFDLDNFQYEKDEAGAHYQTSTIKLDILPIKAGWFYSEFLRG